MSVLTSYDHPHGVGSLAVAVPTLPAPGLALLEARPEHAARGTVLLVPGYTGSKEDFLPVLVPLAAAGWRALAVDQRGQHESARPPDPGAYDVATLAADLRALVHALGAGPVHLVGHSFGGLVCRAAVLAEPGLAASLVLMGSGPAALPEGGRRTTVTLMPAVLEQGGLPALVTAMEALAESDPRAAGRPAAVSRFLRERMLATTPGALVGMGEALLAEPDRVGELRAALDAAGLPRLVLHGEGDDAWPPALQADMARRLGAEVVAVPDALHSPAAENPAVTAAALVAFLDASVARGAAGPA